MSYTMAVVIAFFIVFIAFAIYGNFNSTRQRKAILSQKKNAIIRAKYLEGVESFKEEEYVTLELLSVKLKMTQDKIVSVSLAYDKIIDVSLTFVSQAVELSAFDITNSAINTARLKTKDDTKLIIRYLGDDGVKHKLIFHSTVPVVGDSSLFVKILESKIPPKLPTHIEL